MVKTECLPAKWWWNLIYDISSFVTMNFLRFFFKVKCWIVNLLFYFLFHTIGVAISCQILGFGWFENVHENFVKKNSTDLASSRKMNDYNFVNCWNMALCKPLHTVRFHHFFSDLDFWVENFTGEFLNWINLRPLLNF